MAKNLLLFEFDKISHLIKEARLEVFRMEVGRTLLFVRHCGKRVIQMKVYYKDYEFGGEKRGTDEYICLKCLHHWTALSDFDL